MHVKSLRYRGKTLSQAAVRRAVASSSAIELGKPVLVLERILECASVRHQGLKLAKK
jgi:hypothetical protein